jgi:hypothetical protein
MPYCAGCGFELSEGAVTCPRCGRVQRQPVTPVAALNQTESTAVASLVLGILGFVACPVVCSILAIVFGNQARDRIRANPALEGENLAKAGIILGWVGLGLFALSILAFVGFFLLTIPFMSF